MKKWLSYLFQSLFVITLFLGYSVTVNALTYNDIGYVSEQTDMTIEVSYETESGGPLPIEWGQHYYTQIKVMNIFVSNYQFNANVHYQLEMYFPDMQITNGNYYEVYDADRNQCQISYTYSSFGSEYPRWDFQCPFNTNEIYIKIANNENTDITEMGNFYWAYAYLRYTNADIDSTGSEIGDNIINNNNENTDKVIENNNQNTDKIIESNKETQEVIKDQFNSCRPSINLFNPEKVISDSNNNNTYITEDNNWIRYHTSSVRLIYYPENIKENTQYTFNVIVKNSNNVNTIGFTAIYTDGTSSTLISKKMNANEELTLVGTTSQGKTLSYIRSNYTDSKTAFIKIDGTQLQEGIITTNYEPYGEEICTNKLDEAEETRKGIWETIKSIPNLILDGIKGLFVPDEEELQSLIDDFKETMETKLGAIYQVSDMLIDVFSSILSPTERNSCITFPEIKDPMFDKLIIEQTDYCFDTLRTDFGFLFTISDMIISIVCTLAFGNMLYKKFEGFIGGDTSDY